MAEILVVDDEIGIRELLSEILGDEGHTVLLADSARQARAVRNSQRVDLVLLDICMPDTDGMTLLREWASGGRLTMPVIMMSGHATIDTAAEAARIGAVDFLEKPITLQKLLRAVETALTRPVAKPEPPVVSQGGPAGSVASTTDPGAAVASPAVGDAQSHTEVQGSLTGAHESAAAAPLASATSIPAAPETPMSRLLVRELPLEEPLREARDAFERAYFEFHLMREQGSMTRVAERTGLERTHLYRKLKQLGIDLTRGVWRKPSSN